MYPLTKDRPKALLPVVGKPIIDYIIEALEKVPEIENIYIVTNEKFLSDFKDWQRTYNSKKEILCLSDGTISNETRLGAIGDIKFIIEKVRIIDDLIVIAGDNLFTFDITDFVKFFKKKGISVAVHDVQDTQLIKKYNEVRLDDENRIISFIEKPSRPQTTLAAICMYIFPRKKLPLIHKYIDEGNNTDEPGRYIEWLYKCEDVFGYIFSEPWFDIGDLKQYNHANKEFIKLNRVD